MIRISRWNLLLLGLSATVALLLLLASIPRTARADGIPLPPYGHEADITMPGQKAIIVYDAEAGHEELILSVQLLGESPEAAWVVPVPSPPVVNTASAEWFSQLSDLTQPTVETRYVPFPMIGAAPEGGPPGGVEVLSRQRVGVYDVSVLAADRPGVLLDWLDENGYAFPAAGEPILDAYVAEGWTFVATRVVPGETTLLEGDVQPLWLSFDAARPVYPMRLTSLVDSAMDVLIYVLADHRFEIEGPEFSTEFAGSLTLEPVASEGEELANLMAGRSYYVTKLRSKYFAAWETTGDLYFRPAASDEPYRRVIYKTVVNPVAACCPCPGAGLAPLGLAMGLVGWRARAAARRHN
jgi:hypothetical protein